MALSLSHESWRLFCAVLFLWGSLAACTSASWHGRLLPVLRLLLLHHALAVALRVFHPCGYGRRRPPRPRELLALFCASRRLDVEQIPLFDSVSWPSPLAVAALQLSVILRRYGLQLLGSLCDLLHSSELLLQFLERLLLRRIRIVDEVQVSLQFVRLLGVQANEFVEGDRRGHGVQPPRDRTVLDRSFRVLPPRCLRCLLRRPVWSFLFAGFARSLI